MFNINYKAIIFDLDGVLIDSIHVTQEAFEAAYYRVVGHGEPPFEEYKRYLGWRLTDILHKMNLPSEMNDIFIEESNKRTQTIKIFDGVIQTLERLNELGFKLGIATGKDGNRARMVLKDLGLIEYFCKVIGSDEVPEPKPQPDILYKHLSYFDITHRDALFIGDALSDIRAGKSANMNVALAMWGDGEKTALFKEVPDYILFRPEGIIDITRLNSNENIIAY